VRLAVACSINLTTCSKEKEKKEEMAGIVERYPQFGGGEDKKDHMTPNVSRPDRKGGVGKKKKI